MRVLDVGVDGHGAEALNDAVAKAKDASANPILLSFYDNGTESGCNWSVNCVEGNNNLFVINMCDMHFQINAHYASNFNVFADFTLSSIL